jgi:hypothetical protein
VETKCVEYKVCAKVWRQEDGGRGSHIWFESLFDTLIQVHVSAAPPPTNRKWLAATVTEQLSLPLSDWHS